MAEQRKVVTILFADVVGSTALAAQSDPEVVRSRMSRYFKRIAEVSEAYGGTVEKFAGDAAMVVFGVPAVHDDDAERAVRAALEIRDGAAELAVRVGVNTGEAVTSARDDRQFMVSGDAVNVAARLQQGAESGEVVVGRLTEQLTRAVIEYEPRDSVTAKGKPQPLIAFRAMRPRTQVPVQARGVPGLQAALVGRNRELRLLLDTFARTAEDRQPHLFTLVGAAGVGKSRLVGEALAALAGSAARLLRGRCLPYGRGITYWPFIEMLAQDAGISLADERHAALTKLDRWVGELLSDDPQRPALRARLAVMMGFETSTEAMPDTPAGLVDKEIGWGFRQYLATIAKAAPLIVVVDDLQWAEPPVVKLLEQLVERSADAPLLLVCIARPEFLETHRDWGSGKANSTTITLDPLSHDETGMLISRLLEIEALPPDLRSQIIERSAGTPLFCEEFIHMLIDEGRLVRVGANWRASGQIAQIRVPESIQAVLAARLDGLPDAEKVVLQAASVVGERFEVAQVAGLLAGADHEAALDSLRRKGLVIGGDRPGDEVKFRHLLIRDSAYASLPKSQRAVLHDRFGSVLEAEAGDPRQMTELLAHHAERALTLSLELAVEGDPLVTRARRALDWSLAMGERAMTRSDRSTIEAALATARAASAALPDRGGLAATARMSMLETHLLVIAADYQAASRAAERTATLAEQAGLRELVATALLTEAWISNWSTDSIENLERTCRRAIEACQKAGDVAGEIEARHVDSNRLWARGRLREFVDTNELLLAQAQSIGDSAHAATILLRLAAAWGVWDDQPAAERRLAQGEDLAAKLGYRSISLEAARIRAGRYLLMGDFAESERAYKRFVTAAEEAGAVQFQVSGLRNLAHTLLFMHRAADAATALDSALDLIETTGETWNRSEVLGLRARAALMLGEIDDAETFVNRAVESLRIEDVTAQCEVYHHLGMIRAAQGRKSEAEAAQRRSLSAVAHTDYVHLQTEPMLALVRLLVERGAMKEARALFDERVGWAREQKIRRWDEEIDDLTGLIESRRRS